MSSNNALMQEFLIESFDNLSNISEELTRFENNTADFELLNAIFRKVHTLKGAAGFIGLQKLQKITHATENILDLLRSKVIDINSSVTDVLLESFDTCLDILKQIEATGKEGDGDYSGLNIKLIAVVENSLNLKTKFVDRGDELILDEIVQTKNTKIIEPVEVKQNVIKPTIQETKREVPMETKSPPSVIETQPSVSQLEKVDDKKQAPLTNTVVANPTDTSIADSVVKVNVQLLDKIMNTVGELVLNRNQINQYASKADIPDLNRLAQQLNVITTELQTDIMKTRMQQLGTVLTKFERVVRDLAKQEGKKIRLAITGKETELDKTLIEAIRDPLTHLIRNSVDHGVEATATRVLKGKPEEGTIFIKAYHEGGQVTIEIQDDGNGVDPEKVIAKAISKKLVTAEAAKNLTDKQIINFIFAPGFSTAEKVTNISGRGVGMDVVKSNIEKIGGTVDVHSKLGEGTTFKLRIPLTLAIVPALIVSTRGQRYVIPQVNLVELVRLENKTDKDHLELLHGNEFFRLRGDLIPVFRLDQVLSIKSESQNNSEHIVDDSVNIVILNADGKVYGIVVDNILDTEEIVVKPLSREFKRMSYYGGATIMGDGKISLIIDSLGFFNFVDKGHAGKTKQSISSDKINFKISTQEESHEILLITLADQRTYGLPLCLVNRLEEFNPKSIEWSGEQALVRYGEHPMPLISIEKSLQLKVESIIDKNIDSSITIPTVVIKVKGAYFGMVVTEIKDIAFADGAINSEIVDRKGIMGTLFIKDKTISILDIYSILEMQKVAAKYFNVKKLDTSLSKVVLLVEDSPLYQRVQKEILEDDGYTVVVAGNGEEAFDMLMENKNIRMIVSDIEMPKMNGWELCEKVKKEKQFSSIPLVLVTSRLGKEYGDKAAELGAEKCLQKLNRAELLKIVNTHLTK